MSAQGPGEQMHSLARELFPICRSITGDGLRATLSRLARDLPLQIREVPSGTPVLDWTIPDEWNIREAWIANSRGDRLVDFAASNLHVVNYSVPFHQRLTWPELQPHLYSLPERPDWIPYRTSYYKRDWGFCLPHRRLGRFDQDDTYDVHIDSTLAPGALTYGELLLPGETSDECMFTAHCCHPSLANDNLSGIAVASFLARTLAQRDRRRLSYRFLFAPGTIGAIAWLAANERQVERIKHGLVLTCVGDAGAFTYKCSRRGDAEVDRSFQAVIERRGAAHEIVNFSPVGYDERQFCSPGFNLPFGCLMRTPHGKFPEYHTSADNLDFIKPAALEETLGVLLDFVDRIEAGDRNEATVGHVPPRGGEAIECPRPEALPTAKNPHLPPPGEGTRPAIATGGVPSLSSLVPSLLSTASSRFVSLKPKAEPQLGKYGFYEAIGAESVAALWVLNLADGHHTLADVTRRSGLSFDRVAKAADVLRELGLIREETR